MINDNLPASSRRTTRKLYRTCTGWKPTRKLQHFLQKTMLFHSIPVHLTCFCYLNFSDTGLNIAFFALYGLLWIVCFCRCLFDVKSTWYPGNPMSSFAFRHCYQCKFHGCLWHNKNDFSEEAKHRTSLGKSTDVLHRKYGCLPQRSPMFLFSGTYSPKHPP